MTIRRERNGWRAYARFGGRLYARRFPADTPREDMERWVASARARPPSLPDLDRVALDFWDAYRPGWVVGILKTPFGWKAQVSVKGQIRQKRFSKTTPLIEMLLWRDAQRVV